MAHPEMFENSSDKCNHRKTGLAVSTKITHMKESFWHQSSIILLTLSSRYTLHESAYDMCSIYG